MKKFKNLKSIPAYLPIVNIDTDMIIPNQFLKTIKRTGLGKSLFFEMRYDHDGKEIKDFILNNEPYNNSKILIPQYRYKLGFPILIPRQFWSKFELLTQNDTDEFQISAYKDFNLIDYLISSEVKIEKINFNFLGPTDYDEEKDF